MSIQGYILAGALLMSVASIDMTQRHPTWTFCPKECNCFLTSDPNFTGKLRAVNCSGLELTDFPEDLAQDTDILLLSHNRFRNLSFIPLLPNLKILDLSHNRIRSLDNRRVYDNVGSLRQLFLRDNDVILLQHGSFSGLKNLDVLDISYNGIRNIEFHAFGGLNHLQTLHMEHNKLFELNRLWMQAMSKLSAIHLQGNMIAKLEERVFDSMPDLNHVDLSDNEIMKIDPTSFTNVHAIKYLDLSKNKLTHVPSSVLTMNQLQMLLLDNNLIQKIEKNDFSDSNVSAISISFLPHLRVIEKSAFTNLPQLVNLQIHDNPNLIFIHQDAFQNVANLSSLFLHNNKLMALSMNIKLSLPSLSELHLYHNPLHCDCNVYWIKKELVDAQNTSDIYIKEADKLLCDSPTSRSNMPLKQVDISQLPPLCPPTTLPLFPDKYNVTIGDDLYLECQAIGVPQPKIHWLLPDGNVLNTSTTNNRVRLLEDTAITVSGVRTSDTGTYACEAQNAVSYDISSTAVLVQKKDLKINPVSISHNYITVEWQGSIPRRHLSDFQLHYRESDSDKYEVLYLSAALPKCTIGGLKPLTTYEICIMYLQHYTIHCRNITTTHELSIKPGITRIKTSKILAGVCTVLGVTIVICCSLIAFKKFKKRKEYQDPEQPGVDKNDALSQIPLENLYQPPSTPLCTSRTALLPHSQI